ADLGVSKLGCDILRHSLWQQRRESAEQRTSHNNEDKLKILKSEYFCNLKNAYLLKLKLAYLLKTETLYI
ncbi:hypothetical protein, partial [Salmonella sp. s58079]|uniref:hypothetical protein n=1 Tax=Salmonella sp. s58079 TaxID=3159700 RepID=UPI00397F0424